MAGKFLLSLALFGFVCYLSEAKPAGSADVVQVHKEVSSEGKSDKTFEEILREASQVGIKRYVDEKELHVIVQKYDENGMLQREFLEIPEGGFGAIPARSSAAMDGNTYEKVALLVERDQPGKVHLRERVTYRYPPEKNNYQEQDQQEEEDEHDADETKWLGEDKVVSDITQQEDQE